MSEDFGDWVDRFLRRVRELREIRVGEILTGTLPPARYAELCGRVSEQDWVIEQIPEFLRGEDLRRSKTEPLRSVEE
jgi:hypothetical protein